LAIRLPGDKKAPIEKALADLKKLTKIKISLHLMLLLLHLTQHGRPLVRISIKLHRARVPVRTDRNTPPPQDNQVTDDSEVTDVDFEEQ
jgi:hypothetical protein